MTIFGISAIAPVLWCIRMETIRITRIGPNP